MNDVTVLIPVFNLSKQRFRNLKFVVGELLECGVPILIIEQIPLENYINTELIEFCKSRGIDYHSVVKNSRYIHKSALINRGISLIDSEYIWVSDADCYMPFRSVLNKKFIHDFIQPYKVGKRLSEDDTKTIQSLNPLDVKFNHEEGVWSDYISMFGALSFIVKKESFLSIGQMDERYFGWGHEDREFQTRVMLNEPKFTSEYYNTYFTIFTDILSVHLHHDDENGNYLIGDNDEDNLDGMDITIKNDILFNSAFSYEEIEKSEKIFKSFLETKTCSILTLFRGDLNLLESVDNYLSSENINMSLIWVINSSDDTFIETARELSKKYNDIRIVVNRSSFQITPEYYDGRHEFIGNIYSKIFPSISTDYIITLEDDIIPPKNGIMSLFNSIKRLNKCGGIAGIYPSRDVNGLICGLFKNSNRHRRLPLNYINNIGQIEAIRFGGGFTIWNNAALREVYPIKCIRKSDNDIVGWDWNTTNKLIEKEYSLYIDTDIICEHLL